MTELARLRVESDVRGRHPNIETGLTPEAPIRRRHMLGPMMWMYMALRLSDVVNVDGLKGEMI